MGQRRALHRPHGRQHSGHPPACATVSRRDDVRSQRRRPHAVDSGGCRCRSVTSGRSPEHGRTMTDRHRGGAMALFVWPATRAIVGEISRGGAAKNPARKGTRVHGLIRYETESGVARIVLDHPQSRNALSDAMLDDLIEAFTLSKADPDARVAVL